jgi:hypothetical protein
VPSWRKADCPCLDRVYLLSLLNVTARLAISE